MLRYIFKRILVSIPLLFIVMFLSFCLIHLAPGNYFDTLKANPQISEETVEKISAQYHLDKPVYVQFFYWVGGLSVFDLGYSFVYQADVGTIILQYAWNTFLLAFVSLFITWSIAIPLGILCAVKKNTFIDRFFSTCALVNMSIPSFLFALIIIFILSTFVGLPIGGMKSVGHEELSTFGKIVDIATYMVGPVLVMVLYNMATLQRVMRGNILEVLGKQYILTAYAKGLSKNKVIYKHALRNSINPIITLLGYEFSAFLSGAAIIEIICNWPGLGKIMLQGVLSQDIYLVMGGIVISSMMLIVGNLFADILLAYVDPRVKV